MKTNNLAIRLLITIALIIAFLMIALPLCKDRKNNAPFPEIDFTDDDGFKKQEKPKTATIAYCGDITVEAGKIPTDLTIENSQKNKCDMVATLYLSDGTVLYQTARLKPGDKEVVAEFETTLEKGTYNNVILCYDCYTEEKGVGRCEFTLNINSI